MAMKRGNLEICKYLYELGADIETLSTDIFSMSLLHFCKSLEVMEWLLTFDLDVNLQDTQNGETPLHCVVARSTGDRHEMMKLLIEHGADVNIQRKNGKYPMHAAAERNDAIACQILKDHGASFIVYDDFDHSPLHTAAFYSRCESAKYLLDMGMDVNLLSPKDTRPLDQAACLIDPTEIYHLLLNRGADPSLTDKYGKTLLYQVVTNLRKVELLLEHGADINMKNEDGKTPIFELIQYGKWSLIQLFIERGALVNVQDSKGQTPLHCVISGTIYNSTLKDRIWIDNTMIDTLVNNGADPNLANADGQTPLHVAAKLKNIEVCLCLLRNGADPQLADHKGLYPYDLVPHDQQDKYEDLRPVITKAASNVKPTIPEVAA